VYAEQEGIIGFPLKTKFFYSGYIIAVHISHSP
jgi:hypothetical protein